MADAEAAVAPELAHVTEAVRSPDVGAEAAGAERANAGHGFEEFDLRERPGRLQHQALSRELTGERLIQHLVELLDGGANLA